MSESWFFSDPHLFHKNILKFTNGEGKRIRPEFETVEEMNEYIVDQWNSLVKPGDKGYCLGDFSMGFSAEAMTIADRFTALQVLIKGNHDGAKLNIYARHFRDIRSEMHRKTPDGDMVIFTHRPILLGELEKEKEFPQGNIWNVHGHIHQNEIDDPRYINICVEQTEYKPVSWGWILKRINFRKMAYGIE